MTDQEQIKSLQMELAQVKRERDTAIGAINLYRLTLQWVYEQYPDLHPIIKASILSDLKSYLSSPLLEEARQWASFRCELDSFAVTIVEQHNQPVDLNEMWEKFIKHYAMKYGHFTQETDKKRQPVGEPVITMKNFLGSIEKYKNEFLEANK